MTNPKVSIIILNRNGTQDPTPHPNPAHPCAQPQACTHPPGPHHTSTAPPHDAHNASVDGRAVTRAVKVLLNLNTLNIGSLDHGWAAGVGVYEGKSYIPKEETGYYVLEDPGFGDVAEGCCAAGRCG